MPTLSEIQTCITNLTANSEVTEMVVLAAETSNATTNRSIVVSDTGDLPDQATNSISVGTVIFVQSLCIPVVAGAGCWMSLDNRILRQDCTSGQAWGWGDNYRGKLGLGDVNDRSSPVSVAGGFTDWYDISAGANHSLAVRNNGTAWSWGQYGNGNLGDNCNLHRSSPVSVVGGFTDWCQVSAFCHSLGLRENGTLWAWGFGNYGVLGDNSTNIPRSSPVSVVGGFTDWCQVSAGLKFSLALRTNGTVWSWGCATDGQLGDNTTVSKSSPVSVVGGFTDWCQISAGGGHSLAVRQNGTAWGWGRNNCGQIGDNTTTSRSSPVSIIGGFSNWSQVSAGYCHSLGIVGNSSLLAWGRNANGQLGDNSATDRTSPVSVVGGFTDWCQISAGKYGHSLAVRRNGTAWAWGHNSDGMLGENQSSSRSSPVSVVGGSVGWYEVSAGRLHSLGIQKY